MNKKTSAKIASGVLSIHGFIEMLAVMMLFVPAEFLAPPFQERPVFWATISAIYGLSRLVAGYAIWSMKNGVLALAWC